MKKSLFLIIFFISGLINHSSKAQAITGSSCSYFSKQLLAHYDKGFILGSRNDNYISIIKTDINGNVLWKKHFGDDASFTSISALINSQDGGILIAGSTNKYSGSANQFEPLFIKLTTCGDIEWCKVITLVNQNSIRSIDIIETPNGEIKGMASYSHYPDQSRTLIVSISNDGHAFSIDTLSYASGSAFADAIGSTIISCTDSSLTITMESMHSAWKVFAKINSQAQFLWMQDLGSGFFFDSKYDGINRIYSGASDIWGKGLSFGVINDSGDKIAVWELWEPNSGSLGIICIYNPTTILTVFNGTISGSTNNTWISVIDSSGNLLHNHLIDTTVSINHQLIKSSDSAIVFLKNINPNLQLLPLMKYEYSGSPDFLISIPTDPGSYTYDSLCPYTINTDTVAINAELIVSVHKYQESGSIRKLSLWPVPTSDVLTISFNAIVNHDDIVLIYSISGILISEIRLNASQKEVGIDVSGFSKGMYIVQWKRKGVVIDAMKFIH